jgi:hypothetical protein
MDTKDTFCLLDGVAALGSEMEKFLHILTIPRLLDLVDARILVAMLDTTADERNSLAENNNSDEKHSIWESPRREKARRLRLHRQPIWRPHFYSFEMVPLGDASGSPC